METHEQNIYRNFGNREHSFYEKYFGVGITILAVCLVMFAVAYWFNLGI